MKLTSRPLVSITSSIRLPQSLSQFTGSSWLEGLVDSSYRVEVWAGQVGGASATRRHCDLDIDSISLCIGLC